MRSWSASSIKGFHSCERQWLYRRRGVEPEFTPMALVEGITFHSALEHDLRGQMDGKRPSTADVHDLIEAVFFLNEAGPPIKFGRLDRTATVKRLRSMYDYFREHAPLNGEVVSVETEIRATIEGARLPMIAYADAILRRPSGIVIVDFKTSAARPSPDPILRSLDLQMLTCSHGWAAANDVPAPPFEWLYITKTAKTACVTVEGGVPPPRSLDRLVGIVNTTIASMADVLEGRRPALPTMAAFNMCAGCPFRARCAQWPA